MVEVAAWYKDPTQRTQVALNPNLASALKRKPHSILSNAFSKSRKSKTRSWLFSSAHPRASYAMETLSRMLLPSTKPVWLGLMISVRATWILSASVFASTL